MHEELKGLLLNKPDELALTMIDWEDPRLSPNSARPGFTWIGESEDLDDDDDGADLLLDRQILFAANLKLELEN